MYSEIVLATHAFIKKDELTTPVETLRRRYTVRSVYGDKEIATYVERKGYFGVPLYALNPEAVTDTVLDKRSVGNTAQFGMIDGFALRWNQLPLFESFCKRLQNGKTGFMLEAATGMGKTVVCIAMLQRLGVTALVIVPRETLVRQWRDRIVEFTDMQCGEIGLAQRDVCDYQGKKVVIGMIHSLAADKYPAAFKKYFGAVVWDECHVVGAETFSKTVGMFPSKYRIGMSATPDRKDGMTDVFRSAICQVCLKPENPGTLVAPKVFMRHYKTAVRHPYLDRVRDAKSRRGIILSEIAGDLARNTLISVYTKKFADSGRRTLVLSDRVEQLKLLQTILVNNYKFRLGDASLFTSKTREADRRIILRSSKIILGTYGCMAMGVDVPDLRALIFATPLSDAAQSVGRILRICRDVKMPVVLDIIDTAFEDCARWAQSRQVYYEKTAGAKLYVMQ